MTKENTVQIAQLDAEYKQEKLEELRKRVIGNYKTCYKKFIAFLYAPTSNPQGYMQSFITACLSTSILSNKEDTSLTARTDDVFLTRFLRAKAYHINSAFYMLKGYLNYNEKYTDSWLTIERPLMKQILGSEMIDILPDCDSEGRRVFWFRFGKWNPRDFAPEAGLHVAALIAQMALLESIPLTSIISIYDLKDTSFGHAKNVTPSFAKRMVAFLTNCAPVHILQIHIVRESTVFGMLFSIFKTFLDEKIKKRISIHGNNFESLHKAIDKKILPTELGGDSEPLDPLRWNDQLQKESVIKEMEKEGYKIVN